MLRSRIPELGEAAPDRKARWPECEVVVGVVDARVKEKAAQTVSFYVSDLDTSVQ